MTGGRRKKASDRENTTTALWDDNNGDKVDGEDPLINGANEDAPKKVYKPVCTEDGFVCSRIKPRVQVNTTCVHAFNFSLLVLLLHGS